MRSFKKLTGLALAVTATLGVTTAPPVRAMTSLGEDWNSEPCLPRLSVSDNTVDNTIHIQVLEGNNCPIATRIFLFIQDDGRPQPLRILGTRENFSSSTWIFRPGDARPGQYRVMGINPMPGGLGDDGYISARHLDIDQVITIGSVDLAQASAQPQPVALPPQIVVSPQRVVTTLDTESKQLLRNFDQWMRWFQVNIWPQLQPLIRAIEGIKAS